MSKPLWLGSAVCFVLFAIGITFAQVPAPVPTTEVQRNQADTVPPKLGKPDADPLTIAGKVVDADGQPVGRDSDRTDQDGKSEGC